MTDETDLARSKRAITEVCDEIRDMLHEKNESYGNSAFEPINVFSRLPAIEGIKLRIDDKLKRLALGKELIGDDTVKDLIGYLVLYRAFGRLETEAPRETEASRDPYAMFNERVQKLGLVQLVGEWIEPENEIPSENSGEGPLEGGTTLRIDFHRRARDRHGGTYFFALPLMQGNRPIPVERRLSYIFTARIAHGDTLRFVAWNVAGFEKRLVLETIPSDNEVWTIGARRAKELFEGATVIHAQNDEPVEMFRMRVIEAQ